MVATAAALLIHPLRLTLPLLQEDVTRLRIPARDQESWRIQLLGGTPEVAHDHPDAVLNFITEGTGLPPNPVAWTLACAWSGQRLRRPFSGPALITGPRDSTGAFTRLSPAFSARTDQAIKAITDWWLDHPDHLNTWATNPAHIAYSVPVLTARANY